jgi:photosystem II protein PsbQ
MGAPSSLATAQPAAHPGSPIRLGTHGIGLLRRLATLMLALVLSVSVVACSGNRASTPATLSPEAISAITRQAEGFLAARDRLPELSTLVNNRNWVFTRNLIHGPMQEVGREMLYINKLLLPADRPLAEQRTTSLKTALADLDEAARLQDGEALRRAYIKVASGFGLYVQVLPDPVKEALKQV